MIEAAESAASRSTSRRTCRILLSKLLRGIVRSGDQIGGATAASMVAGFRCRLWLPWAAGLADPSRARRDRTWMLHGVHTMAQLRFIFGEVETVYVREHHTASFVRPDIEGTMSGLLTLERGVHVSILQTSETRLPGQPGWLHAHRDRSVRASAAGLRSVHRRGGRPPTGPCVPDRYTVRLRPGARSVCRSGGGTRERPHDRPERASLPGHRRGRIRVSPLRETDSSSGRFGEL